MALTATARTLTEAHRREQAAIRTRFTSGFLDAWPLLDPYRLDATAAGWLAVAETLVGSHRRNSAHATAVFYPAFRAAELPVIGLDAPEVAPVLDERADPGALRTSLLVTGPVTIKRLTGHGVPVDQAARVAATRAESAAARHVLNGGRATMRRTVDADPVALGWARVTDGNPCWLCAMLASRGPVYKSDRSAQFRDGTAGQLFHDGCGCTAEPVYSAEAAWPGSGRDWQALWAEATDGLSGDDARKAFRNAVDHRRKAAESQPAPADGTPEPDRDRADVERNDQAEASADRAEAERAEAERNTPPEPDSDQRLPPEDTPEQVENLGALSDDELYDRFAELSSADEIDEDALLRVDAEMGRREDAARASAAGVDADPAAPDPWAEVPDSWAEEPPGAPADPLEHVDLASADDDELFRLWSDHSADAEATARIVAELDRRDRDRRSAEAVPLLDVGDEELTDEQRRIDDLVARGWDYLDAFAEVYGQDPEELHRQQRADAVDADRQSGETRDAAVRRQYDEWVHLQWLAAETATRGHLLTQAGQAAGIDPVELFSGPAARARKWASEDLKRWWADGHPRLTFTEFKAATLGRDRDRHQADLIALSGNGRDFGL